MQKRATHSSKCYPHSLHIIAFPLLIHLIGHNEEICLLHLSNWGGLSPFSNTVAWNAWDEEKALHPVQCLPDLFEVYIPAPIGEQIDKGVKVKVSKCLGFK